MGGAVQRLAQVMAGDTELESVIRESKSRALTAWLIPYNLDSSLIGRKIKTNILVKVSHKNPYPDGFFINALFSSIQDAPRTGRARVNCDFLGSLHLASRLDSDQYLHVSRQRHQMSTLNLLLDIKHSLEHTYPYAKFPTSSLEGSYSFTAMIPVPEISNSVWSVNHHLSQIMRLSHNRSECF